MVFYAFGLPQHFVPSGSLGETWNYLELPWWAAVGAALELDMTLCKFPQVQLRLNGNFSVCLVLLINLKPKKGRLMY